VVKAGKNIIIHTEISQPVYRKFFLAKKGAAYFTKAVSLVCSKQNKKHKTQKLHRMGKMVVIQCCHAGWLPLSIGSF